MIAISFFTFFFFAIQVALFTVSIFKIVEIFNKFIESERIKSSTKQINQVFDEWEHVFAKDVNLILAKCYVKFVQTDGKFSKILLFRYRFYAYLNMHTNNILCIQIIGQKSLISENGKYIFGTFEKRQFV